MSVDPKIAKSEMDNLDAALKKGAVTKSKVPSAAAPSGTGNELADIDALLKKKGVSSSSLSGGLSTGTEDLVESGNIEPKSEGDLSGGLGKGKKTEGKGLFEFMNNPTAVPKLPTEKINVQDFVRKQAAQLKADIAEGGKLIDPEVVKSVRDNDPETFKEIVSAVLPKSIVKNGKDIAFKAFPDEYLKSGAIINAIVGNVNDAANYNSFNKTFKETAGVDYSPEEAAKLSPAKRIEIGIAEPGDFEKARTEIFKEDLDQNFPKEKVPFGLEEVIGTQDKYKNEILSSPEKMAEYAVRRQQEEQQKINNISSGLAHIKNQYVAGGGKKDFQKIPDLLFERNNLALKLQDLKDLAAKTITESVKQNYLKENGITDSNSPQAIELLNTEKAWKNIGYNVAMKSDANLALHLEDIEAALADRRNNVQYSGGTGGGSQMPVTPDLTPLPTDWESRFKRLSESGNDIIQAQLINKGYTALINNLKENGKFAEANQLISKADEVAVLTGKAASGELWARLSAARFKKYGETIGRRDGWGIGASSDSPDKIRELAKLANFSTIDNAILEKYMIPDEFSGLGLLSNLQTSGFIDNTLEAIGGTLASVKNMFRDNADRTREILNDKSGKLADVGEYTPFLMELEQLGAKKSLTPQEAARKQLLTENTNLMNWWQQFKSVSGNTTGQVLGIALSAKGLDKVFKMAAYATMGSEAAAALKTGEVGAGAFEKSATNIAENIFNQPSFAQKAAKYINNQKSLYISSFANSFDNYKKESLQLMPGAKNEGKRMVYSTMMATAEGLSESIFDDRKVLNAFGKEISPVVTSIVNDLSHGTLNKVAAISKLESVLRKDQFLPFIKKMVINAHGEAKEEFVMDVVPDIAKAILLDQDYDFVQSIAEGFKTYQTMFIGGLLTAGMATRGDIRNNTFNKSSLYRIANSPAEYHDEINRLTISGDIITPQQAQVKHAMVNAASGIFSNMVKDGVVKKNGMNDAKNSAYLLHTLNENVNTVKAKATNDEIVKKPFLDAAVRSHGIREGIYNGMINVDEFINPTTPDEKLAEKLDIDFVPDQTELTQQEQAAIEGFKGVDFGKGRITNWTDVIQSETASPEEKRQALTELKDQLSDKNSEIATGEALGKAADFIYDLIDEKGTPEEISQPIELSTETPIEEVKGKELGSGGVGGDVKAKNKAFEELVNLIPTTDLRRPNGSIGTQGFSPENLVEVARHIAKEMGFDIPAYDKNKGTSEIKQVIDYLKNNKEAQQKIRDYVVKDPVVVSLLPDNTYEIEDGNHRANLLNLIGVDVIPTIELNGRDKQTAINEHNSKVEAVEQSIKETPKSENKPIQNEPAKEESVSAVSSGKELSQRQLDNREKRRIADVIDTVEGGDMKGSNISVGDKDLVEYIVDSGMDGREGYIVKEMIERLIKPLQRITDNIDPQELRMVTENVEDMNSVMEGLEDARGLMFSRNKDIVDGVNKEAQRLFDYFSDKNNLAENKLDNERTFAAKADLLNKYLSGELNYLDLTKFGVIKTAKDYFKQKAKSENKPIQNEPIKEVKSSTTALKDAIEFHKKDNEGLKAKGETVVNRNKNRIDANNLVVKFAEEAKTPDDLYDISQSHFERERNKLKEKYGKGLEENAERNAAYSDLAETERRTIEAIDAINAEASPEMAARIKADKIAEEEEYKKREQKRKGQPSSTTVSSGVKGGLNGVESFETSKGSKYVVGDDGKTSRFKTATNEQKQPQDLTVFAKFEGQKADDYLEALHGYNGQSVHVLGMIDGKVKPIETNEDAAKATHIKLTIVDKDGKITDKIEASTEPIKGYSVFDQRKVSENKYEKHIGNEVSKINYKENKPIQNEPIKEVKSSTTVSSGEAGSVGVGGDKIKLDPDLANIDPTIQAARNGDKQAQKELEKYGLDWEQTTTYRFVGQSEVDVLLSNNKVESKRFTDAGIDVTTSDKVTSAASNEYRVTFKESFDVNNGLGKVKIKSKEEGDHNLEKGRGYDINDVAKIERIDENGNVIEVVYEQSLKETTKAETKEPKPKSAIEKLKEKKEAAAKEAEAAKPNVGVRNIKLKPQVELARVKDIDKLFAIAKNILDWKQDYKASGKSLNEYLVDKYNEAVAIPEEQRTDREQNIINAVEGKPIKKIKDEIIPKKQVAAGDTGKSDTESSEGTGEPKKIKTFKKRAKAKIKSPLFLKALDVDDTNPLIAALQYFISGGRIHYQALQKLFRGNTGEIKAHFQLVGKHSPRTTERLGEDLWDSATEEMQNKYDSTDFYNAVEQVLLEHNSRTTMAEEVLKISGESLEGEDKTAADWYNNQYEALPEEAQQELDNAIDLLQGLTDSEIQALVDADEEAFNNYIETESEKYTDQPTLEELMDDSEEVVQEQNNNEAEKEQIQKWLDDEYENNEDADIEEGHISFDWDGEILEIFQGRNKPSLEFTKEELIEKGVFDPEPMQADLFANNGEEVRSVLEPLKQKVREAKAALADAEKLHQQDSSQPELFGDIGIETLKVKKNEPNNVVLKTKYSFAEGSEFEHGFTFTGKLDVQETVDQSKPFAVGYFGDNKANRYERAVASNNINDIVSRMKDFDSQEGVVEIYNPNTKEKNSFTIYPFANTYTDETVGLNNDQKEQKVKDAEKSKKISEIEKAKQDKINEATKPELDIKKVGEGFPITDLAKTTEANRQKYNDLVQKMYSLKELINCLWK